jgi:hypothetical protein
VPSPTRSDLANMKPFTNLKKADLEAPPS